MKTTIVSLGLLKVQPSSIWLFSAADLFLRLMKARRLGGRKWYAWSGAVLKGVVADVDYGDKWLLGGDVQGVLIDPDSEVEG